MKQDVQVKYMSKLNEILVKRHKREPDDLLYHDVRDLLVNAINESYTAGETNGRPRVPPN